MASTRGEGGAADFERLAGALGIQPSFVHASGRRVAIAAEVRRALAKAMGYPADHPRQVAASLRRLTEEPWRRCLPAVVVVREDAGQLRLPIVVPASATDLALTLTSEDGSSRELTRAVGQLDLQLSTNLGGRALERRQLVLGALPVAGYHRLQVALDPDPGAEAPAGRSCELIVVPARCYRPEEPDGDGRCWGLGVQLYALASHRNWGHGEMRDLGTLIASAAGLGASFVGINPLHALFPAEPTKRSPYSPSSRRFLQWLYLDIEAIPELAESPEAQRQVSASELRQRLAALREPDLLDYQGVADAKRPVLEALYRVFRERHLGADTPRGEDFRRFRREGGRALEEFTRFEVLAEHFARSAGPAGADWRRWPAAYRDPNSAAGGRFADEHAQRVEFYTYLQWELESQLSAAAQRARRMTIGLYRDVAVGVDKAGADAWCYQDLVPQGVSAGCPPDLRNPVGQDWGVAPFDPRRLRAHAYRPFIELLRSNMRHAGALRLDHAFQLQRLFWVPEGRSPREGGYVRYPLDDLLGILALESQRHRCLVVAEDLGTIPAGFRERVMTAGALSYRVLHRERGDGGSYLPPERYPASAATAVATHDQATLAGFWSGRDVAVRAELDLYPTADGPQRAAASREVDRAQLLRALAAYAAFDDSEAGANRSLSEAMTLAVYRYLAVTACKMVVVHLEDLTGETEQMNLPGTVDAYPNWQRRIRLPVEDLSRQPLLRRLAQEMARAGRGPVQSSGG